MQPRIVRPRPEDERAIPEGCRILEAWNDPADRAVSIARARVAPGESTRPHRLRGVIERYVILEGRATVRVGDRVEPGLVAGNVVVIPAGVPQSIANTGESDLVFYCICTPRFTAECYEALD